MIRFRAAKLDLLLEFFVAEQHPAMAALARALLSQPWLDELAFDQSMLRLLVARRDDLSCNAAVTYADGRLGGRPRLPTVDAFDLLMPEGSEVESVKGAPASDIVDRLGTWARSRNPNP